MAHQRGLACQRIVSQLRLREALRLLDGIVEIGERRQMTRLVLRHGQPEFIGAPLYEAVDLACPIVPRRADLFGTLFPGQVRPDPVLPGTPPTRTRPTQLPILR